MCGHSEEDTTLTMYPGLEKRNGRRSEESREGERGEGERGGRGGGGERGEEGGRGRKEGERGEGDRRGGASKVEKVDLVCEAVRKSLLELGENR